MGCMESKSNTRHEPTAVRGCTDVFWLCLFIVFWLAMLVVAVFAFVFGNPMRLINGYDSFGNTCGVSNNEKYFNFPLSGRDTRDQPYLFFLDIRDLRQTLKICVSECPSLTLHNQHDLMRYYSDTKSKLCRYDFDMKRLQEPPGNMTYFNSFGPCPPFPVYESKPVLHRCIPTGYNAPGAQVREQIDDLYQLVNSLTVTQQLFSDLYVTWPIIAMMCFSALLLSIVIIALMHVLTNIISWLICILVSLSAIGVTAVLWSTYYSMRHDDRPPVNSLLEQFVRNETAIYVLAILATIVAVLLLVAIYMLSGRLVGLAALFEEASKCMLSLPGLAGPPVLAFVALIGFLAFWLAVMACLVTANSPVKNPLIADDKLTAMNESLTTGGVDGSPPIFAKNNTDADYKSISRVEYRAETWLRNMLWLYFIGLIWTTEFIFACQQLALAGAVAYWYFRKPTDAPVLHAIAKLVKYHMGSVAKGSLLITLFKVPRLILTYIYAKTKKRSDKGSECADCGMKSCICCFWFLEKFLRYLNHNAYTVIAIESVNFCPAAGIAWNAMWSNALQVATINGIGDFILFLGKLAVAAVCGLISILLLRNRDDLNFYLLPCVFVAVFAFFVAHVVLSLYEIVVDTLFLCVCEDRTINGPNGRWKDSNLARLLGEEPDGSNGTAPVDEQTVHPVELTPINKQPFGSHHNVIA